MYFIIVLGPNLVTTGNHVWPNPETVEHCRLLLRRCVCLKREIKLGIGLWDGRRTVDIWFTVPVLGAKSIQEHEARMRAHISEKLQDCSPDWASPILASVPQEYYLIEKTFNDAIEMW
jgi:hypothetical protein